MAYLAVAMNDVFEKVRAQKAARRQRAEAEEHAAEKARKEADEDEKITQEIEVRERAFAAFVAERDEARIVEEICKNNKYPVTSGRMGRAFAIAQWWHTQRKEMT
jgi:hypothetical protein